MPHFTRAFRHRNYQLFFGGQLISLIGTWMQSVAAVVAGVPAHRRSDVLLGVTSGSRRSSRLPVRRRSAAAVADREDRHRIIVIAQTAMMLLAFVLAALTLEGLRADLARLRARVPAGDRLNAFDIPARQSFIVEMVGREDLMNAIALNSSMVNGARIVGPAMAGLVVRRSARAGASSSTA